MGRQLSGSNRGKEAESGGHIERGCGGGGGSGLREDDPLPAPQPGEHWRQLATPFS